MKKLLTILLFLVAATTCFSQSIVNRTNSSYTVQDSRFSAALNLFVPRYADTATANSGTNEGIDTLGAIIYTYDVQSFWGRQLVGGNKTWVALGSGGGGGLGTVTQINTGLGLSGGPITTTGTILVDTANASILSRQRADNTYALIGSGSIETASEGLSKVGDDIQFGGLVDDPAYIYNNRNVMAGRHSLIFGNGVEGAALWQFSDSAYSPFQFLSKDTITSNDLSPSYARPLSGIFARREVYFVNGIYQQNKLFGHALSQVYNFQDSMKARTDGGDFGQTLEVELKVNPRNAGYAAFRTGHGTGGNLRMQEGIPVILARINLKNQDIASTDSLHINGTVVGVAPYLDAALGTGKIEVDNVVFIQSGGFVNSNTHIRKSFQFAPAFPENYTDSAFGWFDTARVRQSYHAGNYLIGFGDSTVTQMKFKVNGSSMFNGWTGYFSNIAANYTARSFTDKNYVDSAIAAGGGGSSLFPLTGTGTATGNVIGDLDGNVLTISQGGNDLFKIDPTAGAEVSFIKAYNTTGNDNTGIIHAQSSNTNSEAYLNTTFNGGSEGQIKLESGAGGVVAEYEADTHTFTGGIRLNALAGNGAGIVAVDNDGDLSWLATPGGVGTVTSVGWTGGIVSIANPTTTPAFTVAGTSGGIPYFSSTSTWASSGALTASAIVLGGGAGAAPTSLALGTANQILGMNSGASANEYKTLAVGTAGTDFAIAHSANTVTFNLPDAGASARGVINTGSQTIAGAKTATGFFSPTAGFATGSVAGNSNMYVSGGITANRNTTASLLPLSAAGIGFRSSINGTTAYTMTASDAFGTLVIGTTGGVTEASSGTHPIVASLVVRPITVTGAAGATDILAGVYIEGPATGVTPATASYGLWVDAGTTRLDGGVLGTATNDAATAGNVGEEVVAIQSTYTNFTTTATYQNITSITLTAGDWDISAFFTYSSNSATITAASNAIFVISTTTASAAGAVEGRNIAYVPQAALLGTSLFSEAVSPYRISITGSTTYYLNAQATFTLGNPQYVGGIRARRIR